MAITFCIIQGGTSSPILYCFLSPIISSYLAFGSRKGKIFTIITLIIVVVLLMSDLLSLNSFDQFDVENSNLLIFNFAIFISLGLDLIFTISRYEIVRNMMEDELNKNKEKLIVHLKKEKQQQAIVLSSREKELKINKIEKEKMELEHAKIRAETNLKDMRSSIEYASKIQSNILPSTRTLNDYFSEHYIYYKSKNVVGGDYYYVHNIGGTVIVVLIDCYNKGLTGMLLGTVITSYLDNITTLPLYPSELLYDIHQYVKDNFSYSNISNSKGCNMSILYQKGNNIQYSGANGIAYIVKENELVRLTSSNREIGKSTTNTTPYKDEEYKINGDEIIVLASDGIIHQVLNKEEKNGYKKLETLIQGFYGKYSDEWEDLTNEFLNTYLQKEQTDDITLLFFTFI